MMINNRTKVLLVNGTTLNRGGAQAVIMSIVRNLSDEFCFDILLFSKDEGWYDSEFLSYGGKILRIPNYSGTNRFRKRLDLYVRWIFNKRKVKKLIKENGPYDAIHTFMAFEAGYILSCAEKCGIKNRIAHSLTMPMIPKRKIAMQVYKRFALKSIWKYKTSLVGCTEEACLTMFGKGKNPWKIIYNPYNSERFDFNKYPYDVKQVAPRLIQVASYSSNKNQLFSIEVFNGIVKKYPQAHLDFVGFELENGYLRKMQDKVSEYDLTHNVSFYESDANIPELMSRSSYFLLPSKSEGFGIVLIEAQSMGLKCFVSDTVPKLPDCGGCEFLSLSSYNEWTQQIINDFMKTEGKRVSYDCERFSEKTVMNDYRRLYREGSV